MQRVDPVLDDRDWRVDRFWGYLTDAEAVARRFDLPSGVDDGSELLERVVRSGGLRSVESLTGQFAAVLSHRRDGRRALLRDHLGLVPLHWGRRGAEVVADADLEVVRDEVWDGSSIDLDVVAAHLMAVNNWPGERTQFAGIRKVLPGSLTLIDGDHSRVVRYFDPASYRPRVQLSPEECVERMHAAVDSAVADACVGQSVASHLSGGLDSGVIAALALRHTGGRVAAVVTWSAEVRPGEGESPEQRWQRLAEEHLGVQPVRASYERSRECGLLGLDPLVYPYWGYLEYEWFGLQQARAAGASVVLSGWGGDDFASARGPLNPIQFLRNGYGRRLHEHLRASASREGRAQPVAVAAAAKASMRPYLPIGGGGRRRRQRWPAWLPTHDHVARGSWVGRRPAATAQQHLRRRYDSQDLTWRTDTWWKASRENDLEYRYPLLDQRVVKAALGMPAWYFHGEGFSRWGFRRLASQYLPREVAYNDSKFEPVRVARLFASDIWSDRFRREAAVSGELAELARVQQRNLGMLAGS